MNSRDYLNKETGKYVLFGIIFFVFAFLVFSALAAADDNVSQAETTVTTVDEAPVNEVPTTISEVTPDTSEPEIITTTTAEEVSSNAPELETTTTITETENEASESTETETPTVPEETTTTVTTENESTTTTIEATATTIEPTTTTETAISEGEPTIEASLTSSKVTRGSVAYLTATLKNTGDANATITGVNFELPEGFSIYSASYEQCKTIEPGSECSFPVELMSSTAAQLGKSKIKVSVKYE